MRLTAYASILAALGATGALSYPSPDVQGAGPPGLAPLPAGLPAGIHHAWVDQNGQLQTERVGELSGHNGTTARAKRVTEWIGCEGYGLSNEQAADVPNAWAGLLNWASSNGGTSRQISGHYFAYTNSGVFAYLCEWGDGNTISTGQVNEAQGALGPACNNGPGIYQWNDWKKGAGIAAPGQTWCNGVSPV